MPKKMCANGHTFQKTSDCPVCPICSAQEVTKMYGDEFPKIGAPAFRALMSIGVFKLHDLTRFSEKELLELHGFGPRALGLLKEKLAEERLTFSQGDI